MRISSVVKTGSLSSLLIFSSLLASCGDDNPSVEPDAGDVVLDASGTESQITEIACEGEAFSSIGATCGLYTVDEARDIQIGFARLPSVNTSDKAPLLVLVGGPGPSGVLAQIGEYQDGGTMYFARNDREILLVDYRGVGLSEPFVGCPQPSGPASLGVCINAVETSRLKFSDLRSSVFAADTDGLLEALKVDSVVLWGGSYGTRLALTMMRDVPSKISHVILDGVFPPEVNGFSQGARAPLAGLARAADACAQSVDCQTALGDLRPKVTAIATTVAPHPQASDLMQLLARLGHHRAGPLLVHTLSTMTLDQIIDTLNPLADVEYGDVNGSDDPGLPAAAFDRIESFPMTLGIVCAEEAAFIDQQALDTNRHNLGEALTDIFSDFEGGAPFPPSLAQGLCSDFGIVRAPAVEIAPVVSSIPTLVFSGGMDMQTSPEWGQLAANSLSTSTHLVFPLSDHIVTAQDQCAQNIMAQFLRSPDDTLDTECLDSVDTSLVLTSSDIFGEFGVSL